jgi:hypothetical protein
VSEDKNEAYLSILAANLAPRRERARRKKFGDEAKRRSEKSVGGPSLKVAVIKSACGFEGSEYDIQT